MGVPVICCTCEVCTSTSPYNKRLRPSALISVAGKKLLIDTSPDLREQALKYKINHLDGVLFTHAHHDHTAGLDELRVYYLFHRRSISCLLSPATADDIKLRYSYMFETQPSEVQLLPRVELEVLPKARGEIVFQEVPIRYLSYEQLGMQVTGYRIGSLSYITDIKVYPDSIYEDLKGTETLILSALRHTTSHMHFNVDDAVEFARKIGAKQTWLTHLAHELDYFKTNSYLPSNVRLAYDGLEIEFNM